MSELEISLLNQKLNTSSCMLLPFDGIISVSWMIVADIFVKYMPILIFEGLLTQIGHIMIWQVKLLELSSLLSQLQKSLARC